MVDRIKEPLFRLRSLLMRFLYKEILQPILFLHDPEVIHDSFTNIGNLLGKNSLTRRLTAGLFTYSNPILEQTILGVKFKNPIGLAAGFDKNARLTDILPSVGFGFTEIGTITGEPCSGNPKPRLWRLKKSKSLVVYYGLKNDGSLAISNRLRKKHFAIPLFTSIGKTNNELTVDTQAGINDYVKAFQKFTDIGHFFDINISCPNTFGGQPFSDFQKLHKLLLQTDKIPTKKPIFIKMPPDLSDFQLDKILTVVDKHKVAGFICTNLTKKRKDSKLQESIPEVGGLSGKAVEDLANYTIEYIYQKTKGKYIIIGCGGVFCAEDAYKKIKLGASLIQLITGMVFEGPQVIGEINQGLVRLLQSDGYSNVSQAVGTALS